MSEVMDWHRGMIIGAYIEYKQALAVTLTVTV
jgi:hypothetical protein